MFNWMEISKGCTKGLLIVLNLICILISFCTFGFAVADTKILKHYGEEKAAGSLTGDVVVIAVCALLFAICVFGITAVMKDNVKMIYVYVIMLMSLVVIELMVAVFVSLKRYGLQFRVAEWLRDDFFKNVTAEERVLHDELWDRIQLAYECCGLNGPEDYSAIGRNISLSCCSRAYRARTIAAQANLYKTCVETETYYSEGCEDEILYILQSDADWLLGVAVTSFWFEAVGMILSLWVAKHIKNSVLVYKNTVKY